jgi:DNA-binding CsgD family transcriptional regulator
MSARGGLTKPEPLVLLTLVWLTLGLVAAGIWTDVVGYSVNLLPALHSVGTESFDRDVFLMGRFFIGAVLFVSASFIPKIQSTLVSIAAVVMSAATGALVIAYHQNLVNPELFAAVGVFVSSCGYTFIVWGFYAFFAKNIQTEQIVICIAISLVLETVLSILISLYLVAAAQMIVVVLAPLATALCYFLGLRSYHGEPNRCLAKQRLVGFEKYAMIAEVAIFTAALVFIRVLSNVGIWGEQRGNFTGMAELSIVELVSVSLLILLMSYLVFILPRKRLTLSLRCIIGFAVMLGGLQILAISDDLQFGYTFDSITTAIEIFAHLVRWMVIIECIRSIDIPDYRISGITNPVYVLLTLLWAHYLSKLEFATSIFVMITVYVFLVIVLVIFVRSNLHKGGLLWQRSAQQKQTTIEDFAKRWGLSPREAHIFSLLVGGSKRREIEKECALSEGTVKTHISNIYKKLDVHSKKEMLDLFNKSFADDPTPESPPPSQSI